MKEEYDEQLETAAAEEQPQAGPDAEGNMSLIAHLEELRRRLIRSLIAIAIGSCIAYFFIDDIMHYLTVPAGKLYYMQPSEAFFTYLKVGIFTGFLIALPVVFYHVWRFFLPALTLSERKVVGVVVPASVLLFFSGLAFSFFFVLPAGVKFFLGFGNMELQPLLSVDKYLDFVIAFVLPFGIIFELGRDVGFNHSFPVVAFKIIGFHFHKVDYTLMLVFKAYGKLQHHGIMTEFIS